MHWSDHQPVEVAAEEERAHGLVQPGDEYAQQDERQEQAGDDAWRHSHGEVWSRQKGGKVADGGGHRADEQDADPAQHQCQYAQPRPAGSLAPVELPI